MDEEEAVANRKLAIRVTYWTLLKAVEGEQRRTRTLMEEIERNHLSGEEVLARLRELDELLQQPGA